MLVVSSGMSNTMGWQLISAFKSNEIQLTEQSYLPSQ